MKGWIQIFRTGTHKDSRGRKMKWTERDLDHIVATYDPKKREAPIVIGHPSTNAPAWGWVAALRRRGKLLEARFRQVAPAFLKAVRNGRYKKRSISLYPDKTLRHVGWLGGVAPAVAGLENVKFSRNKKVITYDSLGGGKMKKSEYEARLETQKSEYEEKLKKNAKALKKARKHAAKVGKRLAEYEASGGKKEGKARMARVDKLLKKGKITASHRNFVLVQATALSRTPEKVALSKDGKKRTIEEHFFRSLEGREKLSVFSHLNLNADIDRGETDDLGQAIADTVSEKKEE